MNDFLKEIDFYYENYNVYRSIIIVSKLVDINLFKLFIDFKNYTSYIINDNTDISNIEDRIILIKFDNINLEKILKQQKEYNLLLFYNIDLNKVKSIQNFFLLN
tara:strand:- start:6582 stop:6893 length:312 start_codon:yes stop_codon:yes gene_type:complete